MDRLSASFEKFDEICRKRGHVEARTQSDTLREFGETAALLKRKAQNALQAVPALRNLPARDAKELKEFQDTLALEQESWIDSLWSSITRLRKRNSSLADNIRCPSYEDGLLKKLVMGLEREISMFKERQRQVYDELGSQQATLEDALLHMEQRFDNWVNDTYTDKEPKARAAPQPQAAVKPRFEDERLTKIRADIDALQAEIDKDGGEYGNWSREDHECFHRLYLKHNMAQDKTGTLFYRTILHLLPLVSHETVVEHVNWFVTYEERKREKKNLLAHWRERKDQLRVAQAEKVNQETLEAETEIKRRREQVQVKNAEDMKRRIAEWKQLKAETLERQRAREEKEEAERKKRERENFLLEQEKLRSRVQAYVEQRKMQQLALSFNPQPRARALSADAKERIAERNRQLFLKKRQLALEREPQPALPSTPKATYAYVKSRVFDQTESFIQKMRVNESQLSTSELGSKYTTVPGNWAHQGSLSLRSVLKTPTWRKAVVGV